MSKITLYRLTGEGDTTATTDSIVFNDEEDEDFKKPKREGAYCKQLSRVPVIGIGDNQGVDNDLGDVQVTGNVEDVYTLTGYIEKRSGNNNDGMNTILQKLKEWDSQRPINEAWVNGRFGLEDAGEHSKDVRPVRFGPDQVGMVWLDIRYESDFSKDRENITIRLRRTKGDGT